MFFALCLYMTYNTVVFVGLRHDDCLVEYPEVREALRRLPKDQLYAREFRISRAIQLSVQKTTLPKEEWTKFEEVLETFSFLLFLDHSMMRINPITCFSSHFRMYHTFSHTLMMWKLKWQRRNGGRSRIEMLCEYKFHCVGNYVQIIR